MKDKELFEIRREARKEIASILSVVLDVAESRADMTYVECPCGVKEHSAEAKYCSGCGRELNESR